MDFDENDHIIADARFCYGEEEFNPLQQKIERNEISLDDIKCVHCGQTLDVVNSLIVIQNNN